MLQALRAHDLILCPACGEPGSPNTLDHYLPKGKYPHFAVTPANLFPMCDACQDAKGEKTGDAASPRYFIHPYFDRFTDPQIVVLTIRAPFNAPTFELQPHGALTPPEQSLVTTHLRELEIHERYVRFFRGEYLRVLRNVGQMREAQQDVVQNLRNFKGMRATPTPNGWDHIFYDGILKNAQLINYLVNEALPDFL
jgi:hypothetical protein